MGDKYATYDPSLEGYNVTGHYDDETSREIPPGAVRITQEQWELSCAGRLRIDNGEPAEYVPAPATLDQLRFAKKAQIELAYKQEMEGLHVSPPKERETYPFQYFEAVQWQKDNAFPTPLLDGLLAERQQAGEDKTLLAQKIIDAANITGRLSGELTGKRQRLEKLIAVAATAEDIAAIHW